MLQLLSCILSTLLIPSSGLLSFAPGLRLTHTQALPLTSSPPNLSPLKLSLPSIPPPSNYPSNLTTWPPPPVRYLVKDKCIIDITAFSIPSPQASPLDVLYSIISIREEIDNIGDPHTSFLPIEVFDHGPIRIEFITPLPKQMPCSVASSILDTVRELFYLWGIAELKTVQVSTFEGVSFSEFSLKIRTDSVSPRGLSPSKYTSQPSPSRQSNLTVWPPIPFVHDISPSTTMQIYGLSFPAGMPSARAMFIALNRMIDHLDGSFSSPYALLPPNFISEVAVSVTTGISVIFSSSQGNWYTWSLAKSVLLAVAAMERAYGSMQLDDVIVSVAGEGERSLKLEKFDRHPNAGNIILPRTLPPSSIPSLSLSTNRTLTSASLQEWPATPIHVVIVQGVILTITNLTPVQDYPTVKTDIEAMHDELEAQGQPQDALPRHVGLRKGRVTVLFYATNLQRSIALQILYNVGVLEGLDGAAEFQGAGLVIDGKQGFFSLEISRIEAGGLNEDAEPTISRRSLPSKNKESIIFSPLSLSQNLTVHDLPVNLTAWPPLPMFFQIDNDVFINITAISPTVPPYSTILNSMVDIIAALVDASEPAEKPLPLNSTILDFRRVQVNFTSVAPYRLTYGIALAILDTVLELMDHYGVKQINHMDIFARGELYGRFSLLIADRSLPS